MWRNCVVWITCLNDEREEVIKIGKYLKNVQPENETWKAVFQQPSLIQRKCLSSLSCISAHAYLVLRISLSECNALYVDLVVFLYLLPSALPRCPLKNAMLGGPVGGSFG